MTRASVGVSGPAALALFGAWHLFQFALLSSSAVAAAGVVILLQPTPASPGVRRCLTRIRSELTAGGLNVTIQDRGSSIDPFSVADALNRERGSIATIALLGDPDRGPAELWIVDRIAGHGTVRRIVAATDEPARVPEILAVRALEMLRASALELLVVANRAADDETGATATAIVHPAPAPAPVSTPQGDGETRLALETGVSIFQSVGGPGPAVVPLFCFRVRSPQAGFLRLSLAGLGTQPRVYAAQGSARVGHDLALVEGGAAFRRDKRIRPVFTLGAGVLRVTLDGNGSWPYEGQRGGRWAALLDGAAGVITDVTAKLSLAFEVHVLWAGPHPVIRFAGSDVATIGRPALLAALTLVAWL